MYSYLVLSMSLVLVSILILFRLRIKLNQPRIFAILGFILLCLMLVFDTYLTRMPIVLYNESLILQIRLGTIPLEDFGYLIAVILLTPSLFEYFHDEKK